MIEIVKEKPIKSSTKVEGILIQVTGGQWYGITRFQPARNPWLGKAAKSTTTGRMDFDVDSAIFQKRFTEQPGWDELKKMLIDVLNGAEPIKHKITF